VKPTHRRAIGMFTTLVVLIVYAFFAASVGGLFADKSTWIQMTFFAVAGMAWVIPLYPVYKWMRGLSPEEAAAEKPPQAAAIRKK
jgi:predicted cobalt transporter CbtA